MRHPEVLLKWSPDYRRLKIVADVMQLFSKHNATYNVEDVYFDLGQNWMWTTIVRKGYGECQILYPRDWERILEAKDETELTEVITDLRNSKYFPD